MSSPGWIRTNDPSINSRLLCQLSYRGSNAPIVRRIVARVEIAPGDCWEWRGSRNSRGYGLISIDGKVQLTHRVMVAAVRGPIPDGLQVDHLCRVKACCNPGHLDVVTPRVNVNRAGHGSETCCIRGHALTGHNLVLKKRGKTRPAVRNCRECANAWQRAYRLAS